jgi:hypothetical protein
MLAYNRRSTYPRLLGVLMDRRTCTGIAVGAIFAVAMFGAGAAGATPTAGSVCKAVSVSGLKYKWSVIGDVTCSQAKPWLLKLLVEKGTPDAKLTFKDGPKGFHCSAFADSKGRPSAGGCETGTVAFPKNGFQWLG